VQKCKGSDLYFVAACCLVCLFVFFSIIMPKVQANRRIRENLDRTVLETKKTFQAVRREAGIKWALHNDDDLWIREKLLDNYFQEKQYNLLKLPKNKEVESNAGYSESR